MSIGITDFHTKIFANILLSERLCLVPKKRETTFYPHHILNEQNQVRVPFSVVISIFGPDAISSTSIITKDCCLTSVSRGAFTEVKIATDF